MRQPGCRTVLLLAIALVLIPSAKAADGAGIAGIVRDAQGVAQMGALVQVLGANAVTVKTAFTDQRGRYSITNLAPGKYVLRASATMFVPVTRSNLQLRMGARAVVNLTLATLFDSASWLPAERRRADESSDDWKWTLRSTASRPILRIVEDGTLIEVSSSADEGAEAAEVEPAGDVSRAGTESSARGESITFWRSTAAWTMVAMRCCGWMQGRRARRQSMHLRRRWTRAMSAGRASMGRRGPLSRAT